MPRVMKRWGMGKKDKLMLFSGAFKAPGWITIDIRSEMEPTIIADCESLPIPDQSYDLVVMDPPYSEQEAKDLYGVKYVKMGAALNEAARVLRPGGTLCCLHRIVPYYWAGESKEFRQLKVIAVVGVFTLAGMSNMRALTVWRKGNSLEAFMPSNRQESSLEGDR